MRFSRLAACLSLLIGLAPVAFAQDAEPYVRFTEGSQRDAALQTAVATFRHPTRNQTVVLYGVVHIADADYYAKVQQDLDSYTTVLYEGVAPGKEEPTAADRSLGDLQKAMGEMLGMTFQKDGIDYTRTNLVHADMTMDELKEKMGGGTINPMGQFMSEDQLAQMAPLLRMAAGFGKMMMERNPQMRDQFRMQMGRQLATADMGSALGPDGGRMMQVILIDRNEVCMNVLGRQLETQQDGSIAIFYGAAHMPDLEQRLAAQGFTLESKRWMSAWRMGQGVEDGWTAPEAQGSAPAPAQPREPATPGGARWF
jgi:hypothetical protein